MASFVADPMLDCDQFNFQKEKTMKHPKYVSMLVLALVAVLLSASPAMAGAQRTTFTGTSSFGASINPGEWTFLRDGSGHARGIVEIYHDVNTDPRVTGEETTTYDFN